MKHFAVVVALVLLIVGCQSNDLLAKRDAYWNNEIASFFSEPRALKDLHPWLREHEVSYTFDEKEVSDGEWSVGLERVDGDGFVCEFWLLRLKVSIEPGGLISDHAFLKEGMCL